MIRKKTRANFKKEKELKEKEEERKKAQEEIVENIINHFGEWLKIESEEEEKKMGRPRVISDKEVQKIMACFSAGMNTREMLYYSGIKKGTFYNYCKENPDFLNTIEFIKKSTTLQAKFNIQNEIRKGSVSDSWKWLEKKEPTEFGNKVGLEHSGKVETGMTEEDKKMYDKILANNLK